MLKGYREKLACFMQDSLRQFRHHRGCDCSNLTVPNFTYGNSGDKYEDGQTNTAISLFIRVLYTVRIIDVGRDNSVGIATGYRLDGPGIDSRWGGGGEIFLTCPDRPWGPPSLLYNGYRVFPGG
jgi:hypothetical protein